MNTKNNLQISFGGTKARKKEKNNMKTNLTYQKCTLMWCILAAVMFSGCVDEVDIHNQMGETQKLVLYARLCPQLDTTYILLSNTQLLYSGNGGAIRNLNGGLVELSADGKNWVSARYDSIHRRYLITREEFPVTEGGTYFVRASYEGFDDVKSSCTIPYVHHVGFRFDTVDVINDSHWGEIYNWPHKDVYVEWRDVAGEENYYGMKAYTWWTHSQYNPVTDEEEESRFWAYAPVWLTEGSREFEYVSDQGHDGEVLRYLLEADLDESPYDEDGSQPTRYYLLFLDKGSYLYETTLSVSGELDFLLLEPPHTYTNIEGGFGLFGGFSMLEVSR